MKRSITIAVHGDTIDQIRQAMQAAGLKPMTEHEIACMATNLGLRDILGSYTKLADIERAYAARQSPEPMVTGTAWEGALEERQAS